MNACVPLERLKDLLDERLAPAEQTALDRHIESCTICQERLEDLTCGFTSLRHFPGSFSHESQRTVPLSGLSTSQTEANGSEGSSSLDCTGDFTSDSDHGLSFAPAVSGGISPGPVASSRATAHPDLPDLPGYDVLEELGRGGMGVVYRARHRRLKRLVALKTIRAAAADREEYRARFRTEAEAVARLQHPHIVQIYEVGEAGVVPYFALELLEGGSLEGKLRGQPQPPIETASLLATLARALQAAHEAGIIHRDLKPANVLFTADGLPKVADFGLAKQLKGEGTGEQTQTGQVVGSPLYMAPEQAGGHDVGPGADIYALGVILYEALTGRVPFRGTSVLETLQLVQQADPVPPARLQPGVPWDLDTITLKCLHKDPAARYASARDLADDLQRFLEHRPVLARRTPAWERVRKWARRRPATALGLATAAAVLVASLAGGLVWHFTALEHQRQDQEAIAHLRDRSQAALLVAQEALGRQDWHTAREAASALASRLEPEPRLEDVRAQAAQLRAVANARLAEAEQAADARARYNRFLALRDEAIFRDAGFTGLDTTPNRAALRQAATTALSLFPAGEPESLAVAEQQRLREARYELLLILAAAVDTPTPGQAAKPPTEEALRLLNEAASLRPPTRALALRRAAALDRRGDAAGAATARAEAASLPPVTAFDHFLTGQELSRAGDVARLEQGLGHLRTTLRLQPDHFWAQYLLALGHLRAPLPRLAEAIAGLTACVSRRPDDFPWVYLLRGYAQAEAGHASSEVSARTAAFEAAAADYQKAAALLAARPEADAEYVLRVNRGVLAVRRGKPAAAIDDLRAAARLRPDQFTAHANLSQAYAAAGRLSEAHAALNEAVRLRPDLALLYRARARLALLKQDHAAALADFEAAVAREVPGSPLLAPDHLERGRLLLRARRSANALAAADAALKIAPDLAGAHALRVACLLDLDRPDEVLRSCDAYLARDDGRGTREDRADLYRIRALVRTRRKDYPGAISDYHQALTLRPAAAELLARRGWVYLMTDAARLALADFDRALAEQPNSADALNGRGLAQVRLGKVREGAASAEEAVRQEPTNPRTLYNAARVLAQAAASSAGRSGAGGGTQADAYQTRAWELLRQAVARQPENQRAAFWRDTVERDDAFTALRRHREFATLAARYVPPAR
ncbi:MAG: protein kinase [Gemmataceae bacterium]